MNNYDLCLDYKELFNLFFAYAYDKVMIRGCLRVHELEVLIK